MGVPSLLNHIGDLLENQSVFVDVGYMQGNICAGGGQLVLVYESVVTLYFSLFPV